VRLAETNRERKQKRTGQLNLFAPPVSPLEEEIRALDVAGLTPLEALTILSRLQEKLK
jgi:hypothetical protein